MFPAAEQIREAMVTLRDVRDHRGGWRGMGIEPASGTVSSGIGKGGKVLATSKTARRDRRENHRGSGRLKLVWFLGAFLHIHLSVGRAERPEV
jgi:hypothetical protein